MKGLPGARSEDLGQHGSWRFTREEVVEPELVLVFHALYEAAFGPLRTAAMARQVLTEEEFRAQMVDRSVTKYVAWTLEGDPVGMCTMTNRLETVPWISPEYFAARFPEHAARDAIWYYGFILAHPTQRHSRFVNQMMEVGVVEPLTNRGLCAYDICAYNDDQLKLGQRLSEAFERATGAVPRRYDTQTYYAVDFA